MFLEGGEIQSGVVQVLDFTQGRLPFDVLDDLHSKIDRVNHKVVFEIVYHKLTRKQGYEDIVN
jgi:hypothetical protein